MIDILVLLGLAAVLAAVGIRVGMLLAPRLDRMVEPPDDESGDGAQPGTEAMSDVEPGDAEQP